MIERRLNIFDAVVLSIMLLSCLFAFFRGLVREIMSLSAWIGAGILTIYYFPIVAARLQPHFKNPTVAAGMATIIVFVVALLIFSLVNMLILKFVKAGNDVGLLDNLLGLIYGAFRGALVISLGFFLLTMALHEKEYPDWIKQSLTHPYVERGAIMLAKVAPTYLLEISSLQKKATAEIEGEPLPTAEPAKAPASDDGAGDADKDGKDTGYNRTTTRQLDRLIDSTGDK